MKAFALVFFAVVTLFFVGLGSYRLGWLDGRNEAFQEYLVMIDEAKEPTLDVPSQREGEGFRVGLFIESNQTCWQAVTLTREDLATTIGILSQHMTNRRASWQVLEACPRGHFGRCSRGTHEPMAILSVFSYDPQEAHELKARCESESIVFPPETSEYSRAAWARW